MMDVSQQRQLKTPASLQAMAEKNYESHVFFDYNELCLSIYAIDHSGEITCIKLDSLTVLKNLRETWLEVCICLNQTVSKLFTFTLGSVSNKFITVLAIGSSKCVQFSSEDGHFLFNMNYDQTIELRELLFSLRL
jgi:hypothetical protein